MYVPSPWHHARLILISRQYWILLQYMHLFEITEWYSKTLLILWSWSRPFQRSFPADLMASHICFTWPPSPVQYSESLPKEGNHVWSVHYVNNIFSVGLQFFFDFLSVKNVWSTAPYFMPGIPADTMKIAGKQDGTRSWSLHCGVARQRQHMNVPNNQMLSQGF